MDFVRRPSDWFNAGEAKSGGRRDNWDSVASVTTVIIRESG
jgi:hypothetical protein